MAVDRINRLGLLAHFFTNAVKLSLKPSQGFCLWWLCGAEISRDLLQFVRSKGLGLWDIELFVFDCVAVAAKTTEAV